MTPSWFTPLIAGVAVFVAGLRPALNYGFQPALLVALALFPLWLPTVRQYVGGRLVCVACLVAPVAGVILAMFTTGATTYVVNQQAQVTLFLRLVTVAATIGVLLWARTVLSLPTVATLFALATLLTQAPNAVGSANPWKFVLSVPVTVFVLGLLAYRGWTVSVIALVLLAGVGVASDSRSYAGLAVMTAAVVTLDHLRRWSGRQWNRVSITVAVLVGVAALYYSATSLMVDGALGEQVATRTQQQLQQSGNLITGGRPEWMATFELAKAHPWGLGLGIVPQGTDIHAAKVGLSSVGVPTYIGYVENYMTAGQFKLHSIVADLWIHCGIAGVVTAGILLAMCGYIVLTSIARTDLSALTGYLMFNALWFLMFGPMYTDLPFIALAFGLTLIPRERLHATPGDDDDLTVAAADPPGAADPGDTHAEATPAPPVPAPHQTPDRV